MRLDCYYKERWVWSQILCKLWDKKYFLPWRRRERRRSLQLCRGFTLNLCSCLLSSWSNWTSDFRSALRVCLGCHYFELEEDDFCWRRRSIAGPEEENDDLRFYWMKSNWFGCFYMFDWKQVLFFWHRTLKDKCGFSPRAIACGWLSRLSGCLFSSKEMFDCVETLGVSSRPHYDVSSQSSCMLRKTSSYFSGPEPFSYSPILQCKWH